MTALFGSAAVAESKNLVQFRAGKMHLRGTTVTADKRKGLVYVYQSDDSLMHFCWKDRNSGVVEDDLIIFPDDIEFKCVSQCTTGRAYILKFKSSSRKFFFWMQEPKTDKDEEFCKKVNESLNNPPAPGSGGNSGGAATMAGLQPALASLGDQLGDSSLQRMLSNMDQDQLMQLLGMTGLGGGSGFGGDSTASSRNTSAASGRGTTPAAATATASVPPPVTTVAQQATPLPSETATTPAAASTGGAGGNKPAVQLSDLQSILSSIQMPSGVGGQQAQENVDLSTSFTSEALLPLLADKSVQERLTPFLPEAKDLPHDQNELKDTLQSPQFKQALSIFSAALQSGQLAPLMQQFKLGPDAVAAASKGDIVAFVKALQGAESSATSQADEDMALD